VRATRLYLDTARLGRMSPSARRAHLDFARLAGHEAASPFFEHFLREGTAEWSGASRRRYPGLLSWHGVGELKRSLRRLAGTLPDLPLLLAARSTQLVKLAARLLFHPCRNVLVTDLCWPPYRAMLEMEARRAGRMLTTVDVCEGVMRHRRAEEVAASVAEEAIAAGCDGVFLSAVGHLGYRLPVEAILRRIGERQNLRVVVVDGAQEFCHVDAGLSGEYCDLYLASSHKWLGAHHPLGLGFYGRRRSVPVIETLLSHLLATGEVDDPLLRFTGQLESNAFDGTSETVNLTPLFSCQGAVSDALNSPSPLAGRLEDRLENLESTAKAAATVGWSPLLADPALRSGILLLRAEHAATRTAVPGMLRDAFGREGIALTAYDGGFVRVSMPEKSWRAGHLECLTAALQRIA
jgi:hypothetical protein